MAAKTKKKKTAKKKTKVTKEKAAPRAAARRSTKRRTTKKAIKKKAIAKKTVAKKTVKKGAKRTAKKKSNREFGEGNYKASQRFRKSEETFIARNRKKLPKLGKAAEDALDGPEGKDLMAAEAESRSRGAGMDVEKE
jgi:hypothetical protein